MLTNVLLSILVVLALVELAQRTWLMRVAKEGEQLQRDAAKIMRAAAAADEWEGRAALHVVKPGS